ncbi:3-oxoacyl-ACP synthase III family protein [Roseofilum sp. Belize Diploria]|uniref:3-oxoacyl-ACP synthase III family protein n=1 Tax=Roseofilum sp. Belize Diploria TaxID=2821501 RepID=UPI001B0394F6|nr:3-oxoacyl-[acyl-carrier-protein] synthase III C-terminal domain-containing protein [Roseofilum sp. Belize Diploria]MBP0009377.1 3-oxoacyl-ACP synthase [Roseofilum sp. Belize Diploria]
MLNQSVGIRSLAISLPSGVRTNDFWRKNYPDLVKQAEQLTLAKAFAPEKSDSNEANLWIEEMIPYLSDPFRGCVERRVISNGEDVLTLGYQAACQALEAADLTAEDIDLAIVNTMMPKGIIVGDAAFFAGKLGLHCPAWNLESACSAAMVALQTAYAQVRSGECRNVLVITSAAYSDFLVPNDTLSFLMGDGASAFVVSEVNTNYGILGSKILNTSETWGGFDVHVLNDRGKVQMQMQPTENAGAVQQSVNKHFCTCCEGAATAAGVTLDKINFFVFHAPMAWYVKSCTRALGIDPTQTINLNSYLGNIGPVLPPMYLYFAAQAGRIHENDLVLLYAIGYSGNSTAFVMRWGDVALGSLPKNSEKILQAARSQAPMTVAA